MMIGLDLDGNEFEQDIRELLAAFYPGALFVYGDEEGAIRQAAEQGGQLALMVTGRFLKEALTYDLQVKRINGQGQKGKNRPEEAVSPVIQKGLEEAKNNLPFSINPGDRIGTKNRMKRRLYFLLMLDTGRQLPWGALTGIRPVKIPEGKLAEGWDEERIASYMEETYLTGKKKRMLSLEIAKEERRLLRLLEVEKGYSLYVGIPFCPTTCLYCSFTSYPIAKWVNRLEEYLDALKQELEMVRDITKGKKELHAVYIGGGTPTSLPEKQLDRLLGMIRDTFDFSAVRECTVEAGRPDSITREKLQLLKQDKVSRISINPQSMNQKTLDLIGRRHTVEEVLQVFAMARTLGFDNINMDIILGLPGEQKEQVCHTLKMLTALRPESLTVHCLAIKRAARLNLEKERYGDYLKASDQLMDELAEMAADAARLMGMKPYYLYRQKNMTGNLENVGYAAGDKACLYNILMMEEKHTVIGCGAGSVSKRVYPDGRIERCENVKDVALYIEKIGEMIERKRRLLADF